MTRRALNARRKRLQSCQTSQRESTNKSASCQRSLSCSHETVTLKMAANSAPHELAITILRTFVCPSVLTWAQNRHGMQGVALLPTPNSAGMVWGERVRRTSMVSV